MGSRTWVKLYCEKWLDGTLREETPELRGTWADLLALAGIGRYGDRGEIKIGEGVGFTDNQIAGILRIPEQNWLNIKKRLLKTDRITVDENNIIGIRNWSIYQSEYQRQKPYRAESESKNVLPDWIDKETWEDYLEMRKKKRAAPTARAVQLIIKDLERLKQAGQDPKEVLEQSIKRNWTGVFSVEESYGTT